MKPVKRTFLILGFLGVLLAATPAAARAKIVWDKTGGPYWSQRLGPGIGGVIGINDCLQGFCKVDWNTNPSIAMTGMFMYRFIPNFTMFVDAHIGHIGADVERLHHDGGVLFGVTGGGEFHLPIGTWLDPYVGFGMGYALLALYGRYDNPPFPDYPDYNMRLQGLNFEMRTGIDFFFVRKAPTFSLGPQFRLGLPVWLKGCWEDGPGHGCYDRDDLDDPRPVHRELHEDPPLLFHFGIAAKYGF